MTKRNSTVSAPSPYPSVVKPSLQFDSYRILLTDSSSPLKLISILQRVDRGEISLLCGLQMEMEAKSIQFRGLCDIRRNALTGLDWCIEPDQDLFDDVFANEVAQYCEETLVGLHCFDRALEHLATAIGSNVAVLEKIWLEGELVDLCPVPYTRLRTNAVLNLGIAIRTPEVQLGIDVDSMPNKFVVYHRDDNGGFPFRKTLTHASVLPFLFINLSQKDWLAYSELFGQPLRYGIAPPGSSPEVWTTLKLMLENMGSDTAGVFPEGMDIKFLQSQGTGETYQRQLDYANTRLAIGWLGQNLTTEISQQGSRAAAEVHNAVRADLLRSDIRSEGTCLRQQILAPMTELKFPGRSAPVPYFIRKVERGRDIEGERVDMDKIAVAQSLELEVSTEWLYGALRIPKPKVKLLETTKLQKKEQLTKGDGSGKNNTPLDKSADVGNTVRDEGASN